LACYFGGVSIDYYGHCSLPVADAQERIDFLRRRNPDWFGAMMELTNARPLSTSGVTIARGFGIAAKSGFGLYPLDGARGADHNAAIERVYQVFGTDNLVMSYGMDSIRPPEGEYPAMAIKS
jgi:hypothetical protein